MTRTLAGRGPSADNNGTEVVSLSLPAFRQQRQTGNRNRTDLFASKGGRSRHVIGIQADADRGSLPGHYPCRDPDQPSVATFLNTSSSTLLRHEPDVTSEQPGLVNWRRVPASDFAGTCTWDMEPPERSEASTCSLRA